MDSTDVVGAFVPQCEDDGSYSPVQTSASAGDSWCVNKKGDEIPGTSMQGDVPNCSLLTSCQQAFSDVIGLLGEFVPSCEEDGSYSPVQSSGSAGYSWCVNNKGVEIPGTSMQGDVPNCSQLTPCQLAVFDEMTNMGTYQVKCEDDGSYSPLQFSGSTGYSWCVDANGVQIQGTMTPPGQGAPDCGQLSACEQEAADATGLMGAFVPQCEEDGSYSSKQCSGSTGYCWCVNDSGNEIPGTSVQADSLDCSQLTPCQQAVAHEMEIVGAFVPQCEEDGSYASSQCSGSTGQCWCVDDSGAQISGTITLPSQVAIDCANLSLEDIREINEIYQIQYFDLLGREIVKPTRGIFIELQSTDKGLIYKKRFLKD